MIALDICSVLRMHSFSNAVGGKMCWAAHSANWSAVHFSLRYLTCSSERKPADAVPGRKSSSSLQRRCRSVVRLPLYTHKVLQHYTTLMDLSAASAQLQLRHLVAIMPRFALFAGMAASEKVTLDFKSV